MSSYYGMLDMDKPKYWSATDWGMEVLETEENLDAIQWEDLDITPENWQFFHKKIRKILKEFKVESYWVKEIPNYNINAVTESKYYFYFGSEEMTTIILLKR